MRMRCALVVATLGLLAAAVTLAVGGCSSSYQDTPTNSAAQQPSDDGEGVSQTDNSMESSTMPTEAFELNGITFTPVPSGKSFGCKEPLHVATPEERSASPLDFKAGYLPSGFTTRVTMADSCDGRVASLGTVYYDDRGGSINIARWAAPVFRMPTVAPQAVQVAGKPGVRLGDDLLLVEDWGMTAIEVGGSLPYAETVKIAEGLRSPATK